MNLLQLVVDDAPDAKVLFRQHFRRDLKARRFTPAALQQIIDTTGVSLIGCRS
jgi:hypothetical protein